MASFNPDKHLLALPCFLQYEEAGKYHQIDWPCEHEFLPGDILRLSDAAGFADIPYWRDVVESEGDTRDFVRFGGEVLLELLEEHRKPWPSKVPPAHDAHEAAVWDMWWDGIDD